MNMKELTKIKVIKDTKPLRTINKVACLEVGDIAEIDNHLRQIQVSVWNGTLKVNPAVAQSLVAGGYAEAIYESDK